MGRVSKRQALEPRVRGGRRDQEDDVADIKSYKYLISAVAKVSLSNAQLARVAKSVCIQASIINAESEGVKRIFTASKAYTEHMAKLSAEAEAALPVGLPHHHRFNALLEWGAEFTAKPDSKDKDKDVTVIYHKTLSEYSTVALAIIDSAERMFMLQKELKVFTVGERFNTNHKKVEACVVFRTPTAQILKISLGLMVRAFKAELKHGRAPAGDLEKGIQKFLDGSEGRFVDSDDQ